MLAEHPFVTRKRMTEAVKNSPRDRAAREELAAYYRSQGRDVLAEEQERKASQCERFNPDYDYKAKLLKYDLRVSTYVHGEVVKLTDGPYDYWAAPGELQDYLDTVPEANWSASDMPIDDLRPPADLLEHLADDQKTPGRRIWSQHGEQFKQLADGSCLLLEEGELPMFFTPSQAKSLGIDQRVEDVCESKVKHD